MSESSQRARLLGKFSRQMLIARFLCHHAQKFPRGISLRLLLWKNWKQKKTFGLRKPKRWGERKKKKLHFVKQRKTNLSESDKGSCLVVDSLTSCSSAGNFPPLTLKVRVFPLPSPSPELNCTERDKKRDAMRCFSREFVIYCHRH